MGTRRRVLLLAFLAEALVVAGRASAQSDAVRIELTPRNVQAGDVLYVAAHVRPTGRTCRATLIPGVGAPLVNLKTKRTNPRGAVSWSWPVPTSTRSGTGTARVTCPGAGSGSARFRITEPPPPPQLFTYSFSGLPISWTFHGAQTVITWSGSFCGYSPVGIWQIVGDGGAISGDVDFRSTNPAEVEDFTQNYASVQTGEQVTGRVAIFLSLDQDATTMTVSGQPSGAISGLTGATMTLATVPTSSCG